MWGKRFTDFNKKHGFKQSEEDPCLFLRINETEMTFILVIYVDDGIIKSNQQIFNDEFLAVRGVDFQIRSHGRVLCASA